MNVVILERVLPEARSLIHSVIHSECTRSLCPLHNQSACGMGSRSVYYVFNVYDSYKYTSEPFYIKLWD